VAVASMSRQVKAGTISKDNPQGAPVAQDPHTAPYISNATTSNNPVVVATVVAVDT
jgi:hypothetical protein